ncbi:hypothetical protein O5148_25835 [Escherichia coli]|nr:hypothetical protein [Escherichia coli]
MERKHKGKCPFCNSEMAPEVIEKNTIRRDKCKCTTCGEIIYKCRNIFCNDYAKGGLLYDEELCPPCGEGLLKAVKEFPDKYRAAIQKVVEEKNREKNN